MARRAKFSDEDFIEAAIMLMAQHGPSGTTIASLARQIGAPTGSLYHRFSSRQVLLGEAWLELVSSFQRDLLEALAGDDGLAAALHTPRWVREHPLRARVLFLNRREEVVGEEWPAELEERGQQLARDLGHAIRDFCERNMHRTSASVVQRVAFAIVDMPFGAVYRFVACDERPPQHIDECIRIAFDALMSRP